MTHPSGYGGPAFEVDGLFVWGFTAGLLGRVLELAGLDRPWDASAGGRCPSGCRRAAGRLTRPPSAAEPVISADVTRHPARRAAAQLCRPATARAWWSACCRSSGFLGGGALAMWLLPLAARALDRPRGRRRCCAPSLLIVGVFVLRLDRPGASPSRVGGPAARGTCGSSRPGRSTPSSARSPSSVAVCRAGVVHRRCAARRRARAAGPGDRRVPRRCATIDRVVPPQTARLFAGFREVLDREGFPRVFEGFEAEPIPPVAPPDPAVSRDRGRRAPRPARSSRSPAWRRPATAARRAAAGSSPRAGSSPTPTSWPAWDRHPAGARHRPRRTTGGSWSSTPSATSPCSPCPACPRRPLRLGRELGPRRQRPSSPASRSTGPTGWTRPASATVLDARGADIYGKPGTVREVYSLYARVRPGNSGGPLLSPDGRRRRRRLRQVAGRRQHRLRADAGRGAPVARRRPGAPRAAPVGTGGLRRGLSRPRPRQRPVLSRAGRASG